MPELLNIVLQSVFDLRYQADATCHYSASTEVQPSQHLIALDTPHFGGGDAAKNKHVTFLRAFPFCCTVFSGSVLFVSQLQPPQPPCSTVFSVKAPQPRAPSPAHNPSQTRPRSVSQNGLLLLLLSTSSVSCVGRRQWAPFTSFLTCNWKRTLDTTYLVGIYLLVELSFLVRILLAHVAQLYSTERVVGSPPLRFGYEATQYLRPDHCASPRPKLYRHSGRPRRCRRR
ncbi:hypothetical protein QBC36DRAFT_65251 [Triangularia setosa]|uniref:Uncharacterized protein n=1 Tax=Triangularia setosa TaxID=2587417 RepID=A0AAN6W295_9PEZI|nr:hypothetical protein QBC36DRAFT_65251 [Podospora setosa]